MEQPKRTASTCAGSFAINADRGRANYDTRLRRLVERIVPNVMAASIATSQIPGDSTGPMFIGAWVVVIRVAARAEGLVVREVPCDGLAVSTMAVGAAEVDSVIAWVCAARVVEVRICKACRRMAAVTREARSEVPVRLPCRCDAIMAARACSRRDGRVVEGCG